MWRLARIIPLAAVALTACGTGSTAPVEDPPTAPAASSAERAPEAPGASAAPSTVEPAPPPACTSDETCFFDDACVPSACATTPPEDIACEESAPPPGVCRCIDGACVMRRTESTRSDSPCSSEDRCGFRLADGTCEPGQPNEPVSRSPGQAYPRCHCGGGPGPGLRCNLGWVDPVPCTSVDDCWVESGPLGRVPVRRPRSLRGRDFRPCVDGEVAPACEAGFCVVDPRGAYSC